MSSKPNVLAFRNTGVDLEGPFFSKKIDRAA